MRLSSDQIPPVLGVVLAAGRGVRFDPEQRQEKLLQPVTIGSCRQALVAHVVAAMRAVLDDVWVITRPDLVDKVRQVCAPNSCVIGCARANEGMGSVLAWAALAAGPRPLLVALGDMPWLCSDSIAAVVDTLDSAGERAIAATYQGRRGHPVAFPASWHTALCELAGAQGATRLLEERGWRAVEVDDPGVVRDVDTAADLQDQ